MATRTWLDVDGNLANTANYSGGVLPTTGDNWHILRGLKNLDTNLTQFGSTALADVRIGGDFAALFGHAGQAVTLGALTGIIRIDAPQAPEIHIAPTSVSKMVISRCGAGVYGCYLRGSGTVSELTHAQGQLRIASAPTVTDLRLHGGAVHVEGGATITNAYADAGTGVCEAAIGTRLEVTGAARWIHQGATTGNIGTLIVAGENAVFEFACRFNATITTAQVRRGTLRVRSPDVKTITTLTVLPGATVTADHPGTLVVSTLNIYHGASVRNIVANTTNNYT
jgi:hypothetical protein